MKGSLLFCTALVLHRLIPNVNSVQLPPNKSPCPLMSTSCPLFLDGPVESLHLEGKWHKMTRIEKQEENPGDKQDNDQCYMMLYVFDCLCFANKRLWYLRIKLGHQVWIFFFGWTTWSTGVRVGCIGSSMDCPTSKCVDPGTLGVHIYS